MCVCVGVSAGEKEGVLLSYLIMLLVEEEEERRRGGGEAIRCRHDK